MKKLIQVDLPDLKAHEVAFVEVDVKVSNWGDFGGCSPPLTRETFNKMGHMPQK